jgi:hypothetical protein
MHVSIGINALDSLLEHAASAARLVGHLDADEMVLDALRDHVNATVHELAGRRAPRSAVCATTTLALPMVGDVSNREEAS